MATTLEKPPKWMAFVFLLVGGLICTTALGGIPIDENKLHAPRWVLFLGGLLFFTGGVILFSYGNEKVMNAAMAVMVSCLGTIALWVGLFGAAEHFSGNMPLGIGRVFFTGGGVLCFLLVAAVLIRILRRR